MSPVSPEKLWKKIRLSNEPRDCLVRLAVFNIVIMTISYFGNLHKLTFAILDKNALISHSDLPEWRCKHLSMACLSHLSLFFDAENVNLPTDSHWGYTATGKKNDEAFDTGGQLLTNIPTWPVATTLGNFGCWLIVRHRMSSLCSA